MRGTRKKRGRRENTNVWNGSYIRNHPIMSGEGNDMIDTYATRQSAHNVNFPEANVLLNYEHRTYRSRGYENRFLAHIRARIIGNVGIQAYLAPLEHLRPCLLSISKYSPVIGPLGLSFPIASCSTYCLAALMTAKGLL